MEKIEAEIKKFKEDLKKATDELSVKVKEELSNVLISDEAKQLGIVAVRWRQYTPYFNDGDSCEFGLGDVYFMLEGGDEESGDYDDGFIDSYHLPYTYDKEDRKKIYNNEEDTKKAEFMDKISKFVESIPLDILETLFGDHAVVTLDKGGFDVEHYDHD